MLLELSEESLLRRIRGEFLEMPGMCLTLPQAARLWNLDSRTSQLALHTLVDGGFLTRTVDGRFVAAPFTTQGRRPLSQCASPVPTDDTCSDSR